MIWEQTYLLAFDCDALRAQGEHWSVVIREVPGGYRWDAEFCGWEDWGGHATQDGAKAEAVAWLVSAAAQAGEAITDVRARLSASLEGV